MTAETLRKSILQQAIQGKLLPQNPADEPASELLKKIFAQRQKLIDEGKIKAAPPLPPITPDEIPFEIPQNWQWIRLGDICQINPKNKVLDDNITATFLPMSNIENGYKNSYIPLIKKWKEIKSGFTHFADGDIIFAKITPCFQNRKSVLLNNLENGIGAGTTELYVLRIYGNYIFEKYLLYFIKNSKFINDGVKNFKGTAGQQRISSEFVKNYLFPLPPLEEQKRIVAKLEKIMPLLERFDAAEKKLAALDKAFPDKLRKSILQQAIQGKLSNQLPTDGDARALLRDIQAEKAKLIAEKKIKAAPPLPPITPDEIPFDIPENWQWVRLGNICEMYTGNSISEYEKKANYFGRAEGFDFIATKDISFENEVAYNNGVKIPFENNFRRAKENSVLMCIEGGSAGRKIALVNREVCFGNKLCNFTAYKFLNEYLYFYLQSPAFGKFFIDGVVGIIGGVGINKLKNFIVPLPPLEEQKRIVAKLEKILPLCDRLAEKLK